MVLEAYLQGGEDVVWLGGDGVKEHSAAGSRDGELSSATAASLLRANNKMCVSNQQHHLPPPPLSTIRSLGHHIPTLLCCPHSTAPLFPLSHNHLTMSGRCQHFDCPSPKDNLNRVSSPGAGVTDLNHPPPETSVMLHHDQPRVCYPPFPFYSYGTV